MHESSLFQFRFFFCVVQRLRFYTYLSTNSSSKLSSNSFESTAISVLGLSLILFCSLFWSLLEHKLSSDGGLKNFYKLAEAGFNSFKTATPAARQTPCKRLRENRWWKGILKNNPGGPQCGKDRDAHHSITEFNMGVAKFFWLPLAKIYQKYNLFLFISSRATLKETLTAWY